MVKVWGQKSNRNTTKQTAKKGKKKKSRVTKTRPVLRHWCQASRIRSCEMVLNSTGRNRFTTAGHLQSDSVEWWTFQITLRRDLAWLRGGTTDITNARTCHIFRRLFDHLPVRISTPDLHHQTLRKKIYQIRAYDFGVQFSCETMQPLSPTECSFPVKLCSHFHQQQQVGLLNLVLLSHRSDSSLVSAMVRVRWQDGKYWS